MLLMWRACLPSSDEIFQIEFGMAPEIFVGAEVVVDGAVLGVIERRGSRTVNGFRVPEGDHEVELRVEGFQSRSVRITSGFGGGRPFLIADIESGGRLGDPEVIVLRR
jgi:hypothetical protein